MRNAGHPPGSWYAETAGAFPAQPPLRGERRADVCVVGAGYTGLGAALELARRGADVVVLEAAQVGSGGSGRNGGQAHPGQRREQPWLEARLGKEPARALWDLAEAARADFMALLAQIDCDWRPGLIHARHRSGGEAEDAAFVAHMDRVYGCERYTLLDADVLARKLGTGVYHGGLLDRSGGHLHPLKFAQGLASLALEAGATIHEGTRALARRRIGGGWRVETEGGTVPCDQVILTGDGYLDGLSGPAEARVMPINNFIAVTEPLDDPALLPDDEAAADTRFVINYFRKTPDGRLLFGGGENYAPWFPRDLAGFVRRHMLRVYPQYAGARITHAWGGTLGVTVHRLPFVREVEPGVRIAAGYSGQGVMLAPYVGKLLARAALGEPEGFKRMAALPCPPFPGGRLLRWPLLVAGMSWFALRDRL